MSGRRIGWKPSLTQEAVASDIAVLPAPAIGNDDALGDTPLMGWYGPDYRMNERPGGGGDGILDD